MRVVMVTPTYFPSTYWGGPTEAMHSLANELARTPGVQIEVVTTDAGSPALSQRVAFESNPQRFAAGYDVHYCRRRFLVSVSPGLVKTAWQRMRHADVVHLSATYSFPTLPILAMARMLSKPMVWTPHGALIPWKNARKAALKSLWNRLCRLLIDPKRCVIHVASEREAASAAAVMGNVPVKVIPFGIDVPLGPRRAASGGHSLHLMYLGRLDPIKGIDNLLRALALDGARTATLSVCGTGEPGYARYLAQLAADLGIAQRVSFEGHVDGAKKEAQLARADALVLPSHTENFGLVVAEALARAVPVIASKGTPWSGIEKEGCGIWTDNSPASLAAAIEALRSRDLAAMGEAGRRWVGANFSWPAVAAEMIAAYAALAKPERVSPTAATNRREP